MKPGKKEEKKQKEGTMSLAAEGINIDATVEVVVVAVVSSQLDGIFTFKEQRTAINAFLWSGQHVFALLLTGLGKSLVK